MSRTVQLRRQALYFRVETPARSYVTLAGTCKPISEPCVGDIIPHWWKAFVHHLCLDN